MDDSRHWLYKGKERMSVRLRVYERYSPEKGVREAIFPCWPAESLGRQNSLLSWATVKWAWPLIGMAHAFWREECHWNSGLTRDLWAGWRSIGMGKVDRWTRSPWSPGQVQRGSKEKKWESFVTLYWKAWTGFVFQFGVFLLDLVKCKGLNVICRDGTEKGTL